MSPMILPPATLGLLGGGQLGRFFVAAAHELGYRVWVLDPDPHSPAALIADRHLCAAYDDAAALELLAEHCQAVTTEFENVPAGSLEHLAKFVPVHPSAAAVAVCQNRIAEKNFLREHGLPHGAFAPIRDLADLDAVPELLFPAILKVARFGYDGKGQAVVADRAAARQAFEGFGRETCVLEQRLQLDHELSVVLARDAAGQVRCFAPGENSHRQGILDITIAPARSPQTLRDTAQALAAKIAEKLAYVGTLGVEFFVCQGQLVVNEMAPRPHNSGHHTIDACITSQYEQQVRALCSLPLDTPEQHCPAVMVNLLGDLWYAGSAYREPDWGRLARFPGLKLHLYGKHHARPGRKMGHFTVVAQDAAQALATALAARAAIGIDEPWQGATA